MSERKRRPAEVETALAAAALETLEKRLLFANVTVNTEQLAQTIAAIGGNYAIGKYTGGSSANDLVGSYTLNNLDPHHARIGIPLRDWEASNDNNDSNSFNWAGFKQTGGS